MALDQEEKRVTTAMFFSYGHWNKPEEAHGYKRDKLDQWRELAMIKPEPTNKVPLPEQATIDKVRNGAQPARLAAILADRLLVLQVYEGRGELEDIEMDWPTVRL